MILPWEEIVIANECCIFAIFFQHVWDQTFGDHEFSGSEGPEMRTAVGDRADHGRREWHLLISSHTRYRFGGVPGDSAEEVINFVLLDESLCGLSRGDGIALVINDYHLNVLPEHAAICIEM